MYIYCKIKCQTIVLFLRIVFYFSLSWVKNVVLFKADAVGGSIQVCLRPGLL